MVYHRDRCDIIEQLSSIKMLGILPVCVEQRVGPGNPGARKSVSL